MLRVNGREHNSSRPAWPAAPSRQREPANLAGSLASALYKTGYAVGGVSLGGVSLGGVDDPVLTLILGIGD